MPYMIAVSLEMSDEPKFIILLLYSPNVKIQNFIYFHSFYIFLVKSIFIYLQLILSIDN